MNKHKENQYPPTIRPFSLIGPKSVHFIGVLGIGVSSLARWFIAQKWAVSGSDAALNPLYSELKEDGLTANIGHKKVNIPAKCGLVIHSQAIKQDNPELKEARRRNIPVLSYPQALGKLTKFYKTICVSGMHGKSTTTAMAGLMLIKAGLDPTIIIGTKLKELENKNFRAGRGQYLVLEADEYKDAFLNCSPFFAITTNLDREHLDYFKNTERIKKSFLNFFSGTRNGGALILNRDNEMLCSLKQKIDKVSKSNNLRVEWYSLRNKKSVKIKKHIKLPGQHNVSNSLAVFCLSKFLGISEKVFLSSISEYGGSWRRMEYRGNYQLPATNYKVPVYDDYGHHPTEIKATLEAFREKFPKRRIICVFQPHQAERLKLLFNEFKNAFEDADTVVILPIYKVAGREPARARSRRQAGGSSAASKYNSESLVKSMQKSKPGRPIFYLEKPENIKNALDVLLSERSFPCPLERAGRIPRKSALSQRNSAGYTVAKRKSAVVIMMGAGDIVNYTDTLLKVRKVESS
ncbi:MAG: UDP-N-acetylmuramate--L-alanine ligase [Candidatus Liptonbacteria bacterium]|nr:UDP-N-acetylmuramate--L-alanine ligase [Candidatus Liptonbacteria bacterium]